MAKISVVGQAVVLISDVALKDYETISKYRPGALCIKDDDGAEVFRVSVGTHGTPNKFGVSFCEKTNDEEGYACVTLRLASVPETQEEIKEALADAFGNLIINLERVEKGIGEAIESVNAERDTVKQAINIIA